MIFFYLVTHQFVRFLSNKICNILTLLYNFGLYIYIYIYKRIKSLLNRGLSLGLELPLSGIEVFYLQRVTVSQP